MNICTANFINHYNIMKQYFVFSHQEMLGEINCNLNYSMFKINEKIPSIVDLLLIFHVVLNLH